VLFVGNYCLPVSNNMGTEMDQLQNNMLNQHFFDFFEFMILLKFRKVRFFAQKRSFLPYTLFVTNDVGFYCSKYTQLKEFGGKYLQKTL
jgi:hypothetical protein